MRILNAIADVIKKEAEVIPSVETALKRLMMLPLQDSEKVFDCFAGKYWRSYKLFERGIRYR